MLVKLSFASRLLKMNEYFDQAKIDLNHSMKADWWTLLKQKVAKNKAVIQVYTIEKYQFKAGLSLL